MLGKRTVIIVMVAMLALVATPSMNSINTGIDSQGDGGCTCHGDSNSATSIVVEGLPDNFTAGQSYDFTLTVVNDGMDLWKDGDAAAGWNGRSGGFRVIVSEGTLTGDSSLTQEMKGGLTHTSAGNSVRSWNLTWTAPGDDSKIVEFTFLGNAVNGGDSSNGDAWNSINMEVLGANANAQAPSAPPLQILMTAVLLSIVLMVLAIMYIFYSRNPEGFSLDRFWSYLKEWLTTTDHKGVGILYFAYGFFFFLVGGVLALLFRIQLMFPENDFLEYYEYNSFFTLHGTTMIFLAAMPMIAGFGNYIVPLQIGAQDLAFPRVNALGFWFLAFSCILIFTGVFTGEGADITWVMYPPYSSLAGDSIYANSPGTVSFIAGVIMLGASSTLAGVNFIATIFVMRAPGVTLMKMPLFTWSFLISMFMLYLSLPALIIGVAFLFFDHTIGTTFFAVNAGDPILFQHLFWFFGHPEVYVVIIPAFGIVSEVLATSARRSIFGYKSMVYAMAGIGVVGFIVWGHHMLTSGMDPTLRVVMMGTTMLVAIPTGVKIFNWLATLWGGALVFKTHTLWALGFIITFTLGGVSGMFFPVVGLNMHFHDTYFVVAHFHYVLIGGTVFGLFSGLYYWYPKAFGRKLDEKLGVLHFLISFISCNAAFWPMHVVGIMGMPRRTHTYTVESGYASLNYSISVASFIFGLSQLILLWNIIYSSKKGEKVGEDPWGGWSLEWTTASPPPTPSFAVVPTQGDDNEDHPQGWFSRMMGKLLGGGSGKKEVSH